MNDETVRPEIRDIETLYFIPFNLLQENESCFQTGEAR